MKAAVWRSAIYVRVNTKGQDCHRQTSDLQPEADKQKLEVMKVFLENIAPIARH